MMTKYRFRLATVLRLREASRDERRAELAKAQQAERAFADLQQQLTRKISENQQQMRKVSQPGEVDVDTLQARHRHQLLLADQRQQIQRQREQLSQDIEHRRQRLLEADRQVRVLEKLRQRDRQRWQYEESRGETKRLDEVAARCSRPEG